MLHFDEDKREDCGRNEILSNFESVELLIFVIRKYKHINVMNQISQIFAYDLFSSSLSLEIGTESHVHSFQSTKQQNIYSSHK